MPHYKLTYFPVRARAEPIRIILSLAGADWEDERNMSDEDLDELNKQGICPFDQLPILEFDGIVLGQSMAILRYLAKKYGFVPETDLEVAIGDGIVDQIQDCVAKVIKMWFEKNQDAKDFYDAIEKIIQNNQKQLKNELYGKIFPKNLQFFEKIWKKHSKGKTFFFGDKITYVDINFFCFVNGFIGAGELEVPEIMKSFPELTNLYEAVMNEPKIYAYLQQRPETDGR